MQNSKIDLTNRKHVTKDLPRFLCECGSVPMIYSIEGKPKVHFACKACNKDESLQPIKHHPKTPMLFHNTDVARLHPKMQDALNWEPTIEKCGLILHGTTGIGKSRAAWKWIDDIYSKAADKGFNLPVLAVTMAEMDGDLMGNESWNKHKSALDMYCRTALLYIDDLGKEKLTSRLSADLFNIIDYRTLNAKPTIITTNFNGSALIERFHANDKETGVALVRRIRDYFAIFGMGNETQTHLPLP